ncbi:hypothetical protein [Afipia carboxidovorans]|uniref:hypothetical protein n=1 Tax=Afipia carboxidovorans TaxID=40137 RepID=UPI0030861092|nr:hypothetical protein CRBSH125_24470 [Afipia carboxidovorans]
MFFQSKLLLTVAAAGLAGFIGLVATGPASALSMQECSAKYKAAKADGSLGGQSWNDFRKTKCGSDDAAATSAKSAAKPAASAATAAAGGAVFPTAVNPKYASETPGKARMHTCVDQFNANKGKNANGGMKWIQKGGGYYSACNKRLKGG